MRLQLLYEWFSISVEVTVLGEVVDKGLSNSRIVNNVIEAT